MSAWVWLLLLWLAHAWVALAHAALNNAPPKENGNSENGDAQARGMKALKAIHAQPARMQLTAQISLLLLSFAMAAIALSAAAQPLAAQYPEAPLWLWQGLTLFVVAAILLVLGLLVPDAIGSAHAAAFVPWVAGPYRWWMRLLSPLTGIVRRLSHWLSAIFRSSSAVSAVTEAEILSLVAAGQQHGTIEDQEQAMISSVLRLDETAVREVMVPRIDMVAVDVRAPLKEALKLFMQSGHSRLPVYDGDVDHIRGLLYVKDLLALLKVGDSGASIADNMRPALFVPETKRADELLEELQRDKVHIAVVVDEYGGTAGLVTIENVIEEIVGDIIDEYDVHEEAEYIPLAEDEYEIDASMDLDDVNQLLEIELPTEETDTLGGYIYSVLGRIPEMGEVIATEQVCLTVRSIDGRRIRKVHVLRKSRQSEGEAMDSAAPAAGEEEAKE
ncbi:MAG: hemolysin family protein [Anaerolineaceae bacterium]|nr:hemolysin family protein [Anaerolineaceae bacterium]